MSVLHQSGNIVRNQYQIIEKLGQGGSGITYSAQDLQTQETVAIKALSLRELDDYKKIDLFEREAKILQQLDHPAIPQYLDYFEVDTENDKIFYIVQQLAPGKSLATLINEGWKPNEKEVTEIAIQILEVLVYLQKLIPPVIHRDIKPQNIIYCPGDSASSVTRKLFLVDFGAVQDTYHNTVVGGTVVGTYGYMAPEQFRGQAVLSTDLYGLGTTLLFLLTGQLPAELPQRKLKINFRDSVKVSKAFSNWIDKLIEPNSEDRFPSAMAALDVLQGKQEIQSYKRWKKPADSSISFKKKSSSLDIVIPSALQRYRHHYLNAFLAIAWTLILFIVFLGFAESAFPGSSSEYWIYVGFGLYLLLGNALYGLFALRLRNISINWIYLLLSLPNLIGFLVALTIVLLFLVSSNDYFKYIVTSPIVLLFFLAFGIDLFLGQKLRKDIFYDLTTQVVIKVKGGKIKVSRNMLGIGKKKGRKSAKFLDVLLSNQCSPIQLVMFSNKKRKSVFLGGLLTAAEKRWLVQEMKSYLNK